jgi:hypothetical protein
MIVDGTTIGGKVIHVAFGTTKYCSFFLRSAKCMSGVGVFHSCQGPNADCVYLHYIGGESDSFTKEEMIQGMLLSIQVSLIVRQTLCFEIIVGATSQSRRTRAPASYRYSLA